MTLKKQLWQEIESTSEPLLAETLDFLRYLKTKEVNIQKTQKQPVSTGKSFLEHLQKLPEWSGDDLEESLQEVRETRIPTRFEEINPFDK